jgi:hypothetical protein
MSDEIGIVAGGAIVVDTASLRHAAGVCAQLAAECGTAGRWLRGAQDAALAARLPIPFPVIPVGEVEAGAERLARALRQRATLYEEVERIAVGGFATAPPGGPGQGTDLTTEATAALDAWRDGIHREVERQLAGAVTPLGAWAAALGMPLLLGLGVVPSALTGVVRQVALGVVPRDAPPLRDKEHTVTVSELSRSRVDAPTTLAAIADRMPGSGDTRVRVEEYRTAEGRREFVVYIAGTQSWTPGTDPWDLTSNVELYLRETSASYAAVEKALAQAGAIRGDVVNIAGHSQGAMLGSHLAREGGFDTGWIVTFGSPVQAVLSDDVRQVTVRHSDDPVAALAAGGAPIVAGAPDSFIVERLVDPQPRVGDLAMDVHQMDAYRATAALADDSGDPRVRAFHTELVGLAGLAAGGTAIVYGARREISLPAPPPTPPPLPPSRPPSRQPSLGGR